MNLEKLRKHLEFFDLDEDATIDELDHQYFRYSNDLRKEAASDSKLRKSQQQTYDDTYSDLLNHFIAQDCARAVDRRAWNVTYDNVVTQRYHADDHTFALNRGLDERLVVEPVEEQMQVDEDIGYKGSGDKELDEGYEDAGVQGRSQLRALLPATVFEIVRINGDIFEAPDLSVIVHAVNCLGIWGSGFAAQMKAKFPAAYKAYTYRCQIANPRQDLLGNCLLIPPQPADYNKKGKRDARRWIACLFTSFGFGSPTSFSNPGKDKLEDIIMHTDSALVDLRNDLRRMSSKPQDWRPGDVYSPEFNAGHFGVPWERTEKLINVCFAGYSGKWTIVSPP